MKKNIIMLVHFLIIGLVGLSQIQTPIYLSQSIADANSKGFYQNLPTNYSNDLKNYPLIIWVHGAGQTGQGNVTDLPKVLQWGVPKIISEGGFPASFTVGDSSFSFIVISPQFMGWPSGANVSGILKYVMNNYRVDPKRVYLMGISAGGGSLWDFAGNSISNSNKIAAMIPFCGAFSPAQISANIIAASNLPVWAFHNTNDGTVPIAYSRDWVNYINNNIPTPTPLAKLTEFPVVSSDPVIAHECWSQATLPIYKPNGINIYEWLLGFKQRINIINLAPFANAGQDQGLVLPAIVQLNGSASIDSDGVIVAYKWRKINGPNSYSFSDSTAISPTVSNILQGVYQFELSVTDNLGLISKDSLFVNVYPSLPAGGLQRVLIDIGPSTNYGGTPTISPNINGNVWNNMNDARSGVQVSNALTVNNQLSGISIEVINRVDGTFNPASSPGMGSGNTTGIVSDYPASASVDFALIHSSATNGKWRIKGLQANKIYSIKFWGSRTNTTALRSAEIKRADDSVWKTYNATGNTNYNNAAVFTVAGKTEMDFDIRTKVGSDFSCINLLDIYYGSDSIVASSNLPPIARAGIDVNLQLPTDSLLLKGCTSSDPENGILKYKWRRISGPSTFQISNDTLCSPILKGLILGNYSFELSVTDVGGLIGKDSINVAVDTVVTNPITLFPFARAGIDTSLQLPTDSLLLNGCTSSDPENGILKYKWRSISGPSTFQISNDTICSPILKGLISGNYSFELSVTNVGGLIGRDSVSITVNALLNTPWPAQETPICSKNYKIVVIGSSTAYGTGANPIDSSWVRKFKTYLSTQNSQVQLINIATLGLTSYDVSPTGTFVPAPFIVDTQRNITKALSYNPDAIILSLPSNDVARGIPTNTIHLNFTNIVAAASAQNVPVWVTTTQPRDGLSAAEFALQMDLRDWINSTYANKSVDFWNSLANPNGTINSLYSAGDGVHLNNYGHHILFTRIVQEKIWDTICLRNTAIINQLPTANAGNDILITLPVNTTPLNGSGTDPDGTIASYAWTKISGPTAGTLNNAASAQTSLSNLVQGIYQYELKVTDNLGAIGKDTVQVVVLLDTTSNKKIKVNIYGGVNPFNNIQWNNWNLNAGLNSTVFNYDNGTNSTILASITSSSLIADNGTTYAASATVCPQQVLRYNSANTSIRTLTFSGLSTSKKYNFEFYASRANTGNASVFQIGNLKDTISTDNNVNDYALFLNISPDINGKVFVSLSRIGLWNYIAGFTLTEISAPNLPFAKTGIIDVTAENKAKNIFTIPMNRKSIVVFPNPVGDVLTLQIPKDLIGNYITTIIDGLGKIVFQKSVSNFIGLSPQLISMQRLKKGMYILEISSKEGNFYFKLVKL